MKKIILLITWLFVLFCISNLFAENSWISTAPKLINAGESSLEISWDKVSWAKWYFIYYSTSSKKWYKSYWELYSQNKAKIENLSPNTDYYIVVTYLDEKEEESSYSLEWNFKTTWLWTSNQTWSSFSIESIKVLDFDKLELIFNNSINTSDNITRKFRILRNNEDITNVKSSVIDIDDNKKIILNLDKKLEKWEYKLIVIYLLDKNWNNIEDWINAEIMFSVQEKTTDTTVTNTWQINENISNPIDETPKNIKEEVVEPKVEPKKPEPIDKWIKREVSGQDVDWHWIKSNETVVASQSDKLPQAWPEHWILAFMALALWFMFIKFKQKIN